MRLTARVPMRIDFAGSTLDVYPLYLFEGGGMTVNAAISVHATVTLSTRDDPRLLLQSEDQGLTVEYPSLEAMTFGGRLDLVVRALHYYRPACGLTISLRSEAPAGSGLGASSALLMALSACLMKLTGRELDYGRIIDLGANIEAQVIGIPTGKQDYFPPLFGGVCAMWFDVDGARYESLSQPSTSCAGSLAPPGCTGDLISLLNERVIVSYTGISHSSAATNWAMLKAYIEREGNTVQRMGEIKAIALAIREALLRRDMASLARLVGEEWVLRRGLAAGVTNPQIDAIVAAAAREGASASKLCGAGGGGCMITVAEPDRVPAVRTALAAAGARVLSAQVVAEGLRLEG